MRIRRSRIIGAGQILFGLFWFALEKGVSLAGSLFVLAGIIMLVRPYAEYDEQRKILVFLVPLGTRKKEYEVVLENDEILLVRDGVKQSLPRGFERLAEAADVQEFYRRVRNATRPE
jgi:hypothetical protein